MSVWSLLLMACASIGCLLAARILIHYFQLESYQHPGYFRTLKRNFQKAVLPGAVMTVVWLLSLIIFAYVVPEDNDWLPCICVSICMIVCGLVIHKLLRAKSAKKPLKYTPRIKRLYIVCAFTFFGLILLLQQLSAPFQSSGFQNIPASIASSSVDCAWRLNCMAG